jgi:hypothetical protein
MLLDGIHHVDQVVQLDVQLRRGQVLLHVAEHLHHLLLQGVKLVPAHTHHDNRALNTPCGLRSHMSGGKPAAHLRCTFFHSLPHTVAMRMHAFTALSESFLLACLLPLPAGRGP